MIVAHEAPTTSRKPRPRRPACFTSRVCSGALAAAICSGVMPGPLSFTLTIRRAVAVQPCHHPDLPPPSPWRSAFISRLSSTWRIERSLREQNRRVTRQPADQRHVLRPATGSSRCRQSAITALRSTQSCRGGGSPLRPLGKAQKIVRQAQRKLGGAVNIAGILLRLARPEPVIAIAFQDFGEPRIMVSGLRISWLTRASSAASSSPDELSGAGVPRLCPRAPFSFRQARSTPTAGSLAAALGLASALAFAALGCLGSLTAR